MHRKVVDIARSSRVSSATRWDETELAALTRYFPALMERTSVARVVAPGTGVRPVFPLPLGR